MQAHLGEHSMSPISAIALLTERFHSGSSGYGTFDVNSFLDEQLISIPPADANPKFLLVDI